MTRFTSSSDRDFEFGFKKTDDYDVIVHHFEGRILDDGTNPDSATREMFAAAGLIDLAQRDSGMELWTRPTISVPAEMVEQFKAESRDRDAVDLIDDAIYDEVI